MQKISQDTAHYLERKIKAFFANGLQFFISNAFMGKMNYRTLFSLHFHIHVFTETDKRHAKLKSNNF